MKTYPDWKIPEKENRVRELCGRGEIASHTNRTRRSKELSCVKNFTSKRISLERDRVVAEVVAQGTGGQGVCKRGKLKGARVPTIFEQVWFYQTRYQGLCQLLMTVVSDLRN